MTWLKRWLAINNQTWSQKRKPCCFFAGVLPVWLHNNLTLSASFFFSTAICWEPWWMGGMYEWLSLFIEGGGHRRKCCRDRTQTRDLVTLHLMHTISGRFIMSCVTLTADPFHLATHTHTHTRRNKCVLISHHVSAAFITESSSDKCALMSAS